MPGRVLLYVEDDEAAYLVMRLALEEAQVPIELHRAGDGEQALKFLRQAPPYQDAPRPDLVLLDLNLPKKSGMEVLGEVKGDESLRSIPVIMFSSSMQPVDHDRSLQLGAQEYVVKPSSFDRFVDAVKRACSSLERTSGGGTSS